MTGSWRPQPTPAERRERAVRSMLPGSLQGQVAVASPVPHRERQRSPIPPEAVDEVATGSVQFGQVSKIVAAIGNQTLILDGVPLPGSVVAYLNGVALPPSMVLVSGSKAIVGASAGARAGDDVTVEYAYVEPAPAKATSPWGNPEWVDFWEEPQSGNTYHSKRAEAQFAAGRDPNAWWSLIAYDSALVQLKTWYTPPSTSGTGTWTGDRWLSSASTSGNLYIGPAGTHVAYGIQVRIQTEGYLGVGTTDPPTGHFWFGPQIAGKQEPYGPLGRP